MITRPPTFRAARPEVCVSDRALRRKPSLSASQHRDQRHFRQVESLAQQVHTDQHVEQPCTQVDRGFAPAPAYRHRNGCSGNGYPYGGSILYSSSAIRFQSASSPKIRSSTRARLSISSTKSSISVESRANLDLTIEAKPVGAYKPLDRCTLRFDQLIIGRGGARDANHLVLERFELLETRRAVTPTAAGNR